MYFWQFLNVNALKKFEKCSNDTMYILQVCPFSQKCLIKMFNI